MTMGKLLPVLVLNNTSGLQLIITISINCCLFSLFMKTLGIPELLVNFCNIKKPENYATGLGSETDFYQPPEQYFNFPSMRFSLFPLSQPAKEPSFYFSHLKCVLVVCRMFSI